MPTAPHTGSGGRGGVDFCWSEIGKKKGNTKNEKNTKELKNGNKRSSLRKELQQEKKEKRKLVIAQLVEHVTVVITKCPSS